MILPFHTTSTKLAVRISNIAALITMSIRVKLSMQNIDSCGLWPLALGCLFCKSSTWCFGLWPCYVVLVCNMWWPVGA